jgi:hypothetical protein
MKFKKRDVKFGRSGNSLFPRRLTGVWDNFYQDVMASHEKAHEEEFARIIPWPLAPKSIDEFISISESRAKWRKENGGEEVPTRWSCIVTHDLMEDITMTLKELRDAKRNT